jgi:hypothetical protein
MRFYAPIRGAGRTAEWIELTRRLRRSSAVPGSSSTSTRRAARRPRRTTSSSPSSGSPPKSRSWRPSAEPARRRRTSPPFVGRVAAGRNLAAERARELATGEVWLGRQALELRLVDEIGDLERAIEIAAQLAGVAATSWTARVHRPLVGRLLDRFATRLAGSIARSVGDEVELRLWNDRRL